VFPNPEKTAIQVLFRALGDDFCNVDVVVQRAPMLAAAQQVAPDNQAGYG